MMNDPDDLDLTMLAEREAGYAAGLLRAAAMAEEKAEQQRGFAAAAERKYMFDSAASHTSAGQWMAAFAARLRAEAGE